MQPSDMETARLIMMYVVPKDHILVSESVLVTHNFSRLCVCVI
jgi:hypothetical protein